MNDTGGLVPVGTLVSAFEERVACDPGRVALVFEGESLTYGELNDRANRVAHWLRERGAGPERFVGVRIARSLDLVVAVYAVVKAGAAYVPIEPDLPAERVAHIVGCADPVLVLEELPDVTGYPSHNPGVGIGPDHAAYVIFTSGSTGGPKGVVVSHRSIMNRIGWGLEHFRVGPEDRTMLVTSVGFDVSVPELFGPLQRG
ncbi:AMP-binding protein, partial [Streptomyces capoamus]|uniref:AMP-binding protein n=1 Tax=Streptomyces capoamus TaxID=68183 RepID=UPI001E3C8614